MSHRRGTSDADVTIQQRVRLFLRLYAELKKEPYSQKNSMRITFSMGGDGGDTIETDTERQEFQSYLVRFRQLISESDTVYLGAILRTLPRHVDDATLRERLAKATDMWKAANGIPSPLAPLTLGEFASGRETARLYLSGGVFHSNVRLSSIWDAIGPNQQRLVEYQFRMYEGRVRDVFIELKKIIDEATAAGVLRDDPIDLTGEAGTA